MNPTDIMKYGQRTVLRTLEAFPEPAVELAGACGVWSVKDIISHLASHEHVLVDVLSTFVGGVATPYLKEMTAEGGQGFNDAEVARRKGNTLTEVLKEFEDTHRQALSVAGQISPELFPKAGTLPWYGMEYALDDYIVYGFYGHKREHSAQIAAFRDVIQH
jgi:Mycothiol maleylpyruvate isomerase N-terminal domain